MAPSVVPHSPPDVFGNIPDIHHQLTDGLVRKLRSLNCRIQVSYVGVVMFAVMDFHRARVNVRLERIICIAKIGKCMSHWNNVLIDVSMFALRLPEISG